MTEEIGNAFDVLGETSDDGEGRRQRELASHGNIIDGRKRKRVSRPAQIAMKTSFKKREQLQRLAIRMGEGVTFVQAFEAALDALEEKLNREGGR